MNIDNRVTSPFLFREEEYILPEDAINTHTNYQAIYCIESNLYVYYYWGEKHYKWFRCGVSYEYNDNYGNLQ